MVETSSGPVEVSQPLLDSGADVRIVKMEDGTIVWERKAFRAVFTTTGDFDFDISHDAEYSTDGEVTWVSIGPGVNRIPAALAGTVILKSSHWITK